MQSVLKIIANMLFLFKSSNPFYILIINCWYIWWCSHAGHNNWKPETFNWKVGLNLSIWWSFLKSLMNSWSAWYMIVTIVHKTSSHPASLSSWNWVYKASPHISDWSHCLSPHYTFQFYNCLPRQTEHWGLCINHSPAGNYDAWGKSRIPLFQWAFQASTSRNNSSYGWIFPTP